MLSGPSGGLLLVYLGFWEIVSERGWVCDDKEKGRACELSESACCELGKRHGWSPVCCGNCHRSHSCSGPNVGRGHGEHFTASQDSPLGEVPPSCPVCALLHKSCGDIEPPLLTASWEISHCRAVFPKA